MQARPTTDGDWSGWADGTHDAAFEVLGAHPVDRVAGPQQYGEGGAIDWDLRVWAPNASEVSVIGDFNGWNAQSDTMMPSDRGVWSATVTARPGTRYKYRIVSDAGTVDKADPFAFHSEEPPGTASVLWDLSYEWNDDAWMQERGQRQALDQPISIYELHMGSWDRHGDDGHGGPTNYRTIAPRLAEHVKACGFTHVELLPVMEHPFYGSWGYQSTGYFSPTCRYGSPQDLMAMIDHLHSEGIGVIFDWVPSHFPEDDWALAKFDGTHLFEHADPKLGFHPDWKSLIFNYGRSEVRSFLVSSARFWLREYHVDGLRVDAVASMLYLDYSREDGEWIPNQFGGNENLEAISFMQQLNTSLYYHHPDIQMIAEESTAWPGVTKPVDQGGLGFGLKWDMGWMHDTLEYFKEDPINRKYHHREITFRSNWAFTENYVLPLSHDEVVHGKRSLIGRMPGDDWQRVANLRLLYGYQWSQPGKKLMFMGDEVGQWDEWNHEAEVPWRPGDPHRPDHADQIRDWVRALNDLYRRTRSLHRGDCDPGGFEWLVGDDFDTSVVGYARRDPDGEDITLVVANFTPVIRRGYRIGAPTDRWWEEGLSSDDVAFGGSGVHNRAMRSDGDPWQGQPHSLLVDLPPLGIVFIRPASGFDGPTEDDSHLRVEDHLPSYTHEDQPGDTARDQASDDSTGHTNRHNTHSMDEGVDDDKD